MVEILEELCIMIAVRTGFFLKSNNPISSTCDYDFQLIQKVKAWLYQHWLLRYLLKCAHMAQQVHTSEDISI